MNLLVNVVVYPSKKLLWIFALNMMSTLNENLPATDYFELPRF